MSTPAAPDPEAARLLRSGGRRRLGRNLVRRSGRRDGWSLFGLLGRFAVGFSQGRRRRVRGRLRDLGEMFHADSLAQNLASGFLSLPALAIQIAFFQHGIGLLCGLNNGIVAVLLDQKVSDAVYLDPIHIGMIAQDAPGRKKPSEAFFGP